MLFDPGRGINVRPTTELLLLWTRPLGDWRKPVRRLARRLLIVRGSSQIPGPLLSLVKAKHAPCVPPKAGSLLRRHRYSSPNEGTGRLRCSVCSVGLKLLAQPVRLPATVDERSGKFAQRAGKRQFGVACLQAVLHRRRDPPLGVRGTHSLAEEIGVVTKILDGRERDRVYSILDHGVARSRKPGDPVSKGADEIAKRIGGQGAIDPAVPLRQLGVVVVGAEHHLERSRATHQAREVLSAPTARE